MNDGKLTLAVFDFDGTLTEGHLWKGIWLHHNSKKIKRWSLISYMLTHIPFWLAAKIKLYPQELNRISWGRDLAYLLKDLTVEQSRTAFVWISERYFRPLMRLDMLKIIEEHRQQGHRIVLLSGMFSEFLEVIGPLIGADDVVGTALEKKEGVYTGKIVPPLCFGENKSSYLQGYIRKKALDVDYSASYAYADSIFDSPVFRLVGHPVAVYPDKDLLKQARRSGWDIIGE